MKNYIDLIDQTIEFPTREFNINENNELLFNNVPLMEIIKQYGTPLKVSYLPKISEHIENAKLLFRNAIKKYNYKGNYTYCYCTKSSHFSFILEEVLKQNVHLETSSAFDIPIIRDMYNQGKISKSTYILCNGYKQPLYTQYISELINDGFNCIPVLDNLKEIDFYEKSVTAEKVNIAIRIATDEEPDFAFYTSRLGLRYSDVNTLYNEKIKPNPRFNLKMLHFFINTGIKDSAYYWSELSRFVYKYCEMKKICPELDSINIGGGFPIKHSLGFEYDYQFMINEIVSNIKKACKKAKVPMPNIYTEFGSYTVGESMAHIYSVLAQKTQNDRENWYMIDSSFITTLPDTWGIGEKFLMMPINKWENEYQRVVLGGITCDSHDYYDSEEHINEVFLPKLNGEAAAEPLYVGFFHTGAYQESLGGYGGIQHCLIPAPKHVLVDRLEDGTITTQLFASAQESYGMLNILGYGSTEKAEAQATVLSQEEVKHAENLSLIEQ